MNVFIFISEVDTRNRYASFEAIFCASKLAQQVYESVKQNM